MVVRLRISLHGPRHGKTCRLVLGMWNPRTLPGESTKTVRWSVDRIRYWLKVGAKPTDTVQRLLDLGSIKPPQPKSSHSGAEASKPAQSA
ncbi:uncharacterized protein B0H18DRAFT_969524 [Fomitopsis serialis]|uniref:uncharacterized protein n=1 Tax=Fomitopsis serialis TaxID=139415 RepID=UPI00200722A5|nr:uncharacterized protein B0H18DRAFT_969524 [Neoantrodia serialis]KAH9937193.1 hypothetical protein B0H18DRAFT_969524 [Neoantrodia serialis]